MFKLLFKPAQSGFALLKVFGTLANLAAIVALLLALAALILVFTGTGNPFVLLNPTVPVALGLIYVPALLLLGQLLHWMAAMYELRVQANELLAEGKDQLSPARGGG